MATNSLKTTANFQHGLSHIKYKSSAVKLANNSIFPSQLGYLDTHPGGYYAKQSPRVKEFENVQYQNFTAGFPIFAKYNVVRGCVTDCVNASI